MNHVSISPDEKLFAFATNKGTVCLVEINNKNAKDIQVYNEHVGNTITAMKWNEYTEELYVGDNTGKISVIINANFIVSKENFDINVRCIVYIFIYLFSD